MAFANTISSDLGGIIGIDPLSRLSNDRSAVPQDVAKVSVTSGNVAASAATAALSAPGAGKTNYCTAIQFSFLGATAASTIIGTLTGCQGPSSWPIYVPAGAAVAGKDFIVQFSPPLPAIATNTAITFSVPSTGTGGLTAASFIEGYVI